MFGFLIFGLVSNRMMSDYKVEMINDGMQEFYVHFHGPSDSKSSIPTYPFVFWFFFFLVFPNCWSLNENLSSLRWLLFWVFAILISFSWFSYSDHLYMSYMLFFGGFLVENWLWVFGILVIWFIFPFGQ